MRLDVLRELNFNSIKVQLEHAITIKTGAADLFQFHKGTIRTRLLRSAGLLLHPISIP